MPCRDTPPFERGCCPWLSRVAGVVGSRWGASSGSAPSGCGRRDRVVAVAGVQNARHADVERVVARRWETFDVTFWAATARVSDRAESGMAAVSAADSERFAARYRLAGLDVIKVTELAATGSDYGATGYSTMAQVEDLAGRLALGSGDVVLDLGSGAGWPGLHLAKLTGCSVVVCDPVDEGPQAARLRAESDDIAGRAWAVPADGRALPFAAASLDAVVHSDALC